MTAPIVVTDENDPRVFSTLLRMAVPTVGAGLLKSSFALVDTHTAGQLSTTVMAGLTAAVFFAWMFHSLSSMVSIGALSLVAQCVGVHDDEGVHRRINEGLRHAAVVGVFASTAFFFLAPPTLATLGLGDATVDAVSYLRVLAVFGPMFWLLDCTEQIFRATGDARTPVVVTFVAAVVNVVLNPMLAHDFGLGLTGIALATGIAWTFGASTLIFILRRRGYLRGVLSSPVARSEFPATPGRVTLANRGEDDDDGRAPAGSRRGITAFLVIGFPVAMSGVAFDLIWVFLAPVASTSGPVTMAAIGIGHRLESLGYLTALGVANATAALVGQAWGARRIPLIKRLVTQAVILGIAASGLWAAIQLAFAEPLFRIFTVDEDVVAMGRDYIALSAVSTVTQAVETIVLGGFEGMGRTLVPFTASLLSYALRIPLAMSLVTMGAVGIFLSTSITAMLAGVVVTLLFIFRGPRHADDATKTASTIALQNASVDDTMSNAER